MQEQQVVSSNQQERDVFGFAYRNGIASIQGLFIRDNKLLGSKSFYPKVPAQSSDAEVFQSFVLQFYLAGNKIIPQQIVIPCELEEQTAIEDMLTKEAGRKIQFYKGVRDEKRRYLDLANTNAETALESRQNHQNSSFARYIELQPISEF